jgi:hypothetical protein
MMLKEFRSHNLYFCVLPKDLLNELINISTNEYRLYFKTQTDALGRIFYTCKYEDRGCRIRFPIRNLDEVRIIVTIDIDNDTHMNYCIKFYQLSDCEFTVNNLSRIQSNNIAYKFRHVLERFRSFNLEKDWKGRGEYISCFL